MAGDVLGAEKGTCYGVYPGKEYQTANYLISSVVLVVLIVVEVEVP